MKLKGTKRFLATILCLAMVFVGVNIPALGAKAEEVSYTNLGGNVYVTDDSICIKNSDGVLEDSDKLLADAGISYDSASHKLTLDNVCLVGDVSPMFEITSSTDFTVELIGDNYLKKDSGYTFKAQFGEADNTIIFTGDGVIHTDGGQGIYSDQSITFDGITYYGTSVNALIEAHKDATITDSTIESLDGHYQMQIGGNLAIEASNIQLESLEVSMLAVGSVTIKDSSLDLLSLSRDAISATEALEINNSVIKAQNGTETSFAGAPCMHTSGKFSILNNSKVDIYSYQQAIKGSEVVIIDSDVTAKSPNVPIECASLNVSNHSTVDVETLDSNAPAVYAGYISIDASTFKASGYHDAIQTVFFRASYSTIDLKASKEAATAIKANAILFYDCLTTIDVTGVVLEGGSEINEFALYVDENDKQLDNGVAYSNGKVQILGGTMDINVNGNAGIGIHCNQLELDGSKTEITTNKAATQADSIYEGVSTIVGGADSVSATAIAVDDMNTCAYAKITPNDTSDEDEEPFYLGGFNIVLEKDGVYFDAHLNTNYGKTLEELGITYDVENHVLTLENVNLKTTGTFITNKTVPDLTIVVKGNNTFSTNSDFIYGTIGNDKPLTITGDGTLNLDTYRLGQLKQSVVISGITINADTVEELVQTTKNVTISDATIKAPKNRYLVEANGDVAITDSTINVDARIYTIKGNNVSLKNCTMEISAKDEPGIYACGNLVIDNTNLTVIKVENVYSAVPAFNVQGDFSIVNKSNVKATSIENIGVQTSKKLTIADSTLTVNADTSGIICGDLEVSDDAVVTVNAGIVGIICGDLAVLDDAVVTVTGGKAAINSENSAALDSNKWAIYGGADKESAIEISAKDMINVKYVSISKKVVTGWKPIDGKWYYYLADGKMQTGWAKISGTWYYFNADGTMATGWLKDGGKWYYLGSNGAMVTGWLKDGGKWYYLGSNGVMRTGWLNDGGKYYYLNSDGSMQTGWKKVNGKWYYLNASGVMQTGWLNDGGKWYYLDASGAMRTGWVKVSNDWYYFDANGVMETGWKLIDGDYYYFYSSGKMAANTTIDGKYYVNSTGKYVK